MSDLMQATGLQKGGLYRHFESKEALALEALDFAIGRMAVRFRAALGTKHDAVDQVRALCEGALMLSQLYGDSAPMHKSMGFLHRYLDEQVRAPG